MSWRRALGALFPVLLGVGASSLLVGAPADASSGRCAPGTGVTVVVDYGPLGGGTPIGCDPSGAGKSASSVVPAAGFKLTYVNGEGFVCRIHGKPGASRESCTHTPPEDAYWALFWSDGTSTTWKYSSSGVSGLSVPKGGSIGWRFEDGGARESPSQPPTQNPAEPSPSPSPSKSPKPTHSPRPTPSAAPQPTRTPTAQGSTPPPSSAPPSGGAATPPPPTPSGSAAAAPPPGGGHGHGSGHGKAAAASPPPDQAGKAAGHAHRDRVEASADTHATAVSASGQKVLTAVAASSVVLLGAAVGVAGWRRRS